MPITFLTWNPENELVPPGNIFKSPPSVNKCSGSDHANIKIPYFYQHLFLINEEDILWYILVMKYSKEVNFINDKM